MNDLLDDIKADDYTDAIANGNLRKKKPSPEAVPFERFTLTGYRLRVYDELCACGVNHRSITLAYRETGSLGSIRERSCDTLPDIATPKLEPARLYASLSLCPECVENKFGFSLPPIKVE